MKRLRELQVGDEKLYPVFWMDYLKGTEMPRSERTPENLETASQVLGYEMSLNSEL